MWYLLFCGRFSDMPFRWIFESGVEVWLWCLDVVVRMPKKSQSPIYFYIPKLHRRFGDASEKKFDCRVTTSQWLKLLQCGLSAHQSLHNSKCVDWMLWAYTLHEIWVSRCQAVFQGSLIRARTICRKVISKIQLTSIISSPKSTCSKFQQNILGIMGIQFQPHPQRRGIWCKWDTPASGWLKLNFDGSARDGRITGGGVVRDEECRFILGYSIYFGEGSNNRAEFLALAEGLRLCQAFEFERVCI